MRRNSSKVANYTMKGLCIFAVLHILPLTGCGPSPEDGVAELVSALVTKTQLVQTNTYTSASSTPAPSSSVSPTASPSTTPTLPPLVACNGDVFNISGGSGGTLSLTDTSPSPGPSQIVGVSLNMAVLTGPGFGGSSSSTSTSSSSTTSTVPTLICTLTTYGWSLSASTIQFTGTGIVPNCSNFSCIYNGRALNCGDIQAAFTKLNANGGCL